MQWDESPGKDAARRAEETPRQRSCGAAVDILLEAVALRQAVPVRWNAIPAPPYFIITLDYIFLQFFLKMQYR